MADKKGTDDGAWFILREAEDADDSLENLDSFEELFDASASDISDLIDDCEADQGNSLALFNEQELTEACETINNLQNRKQTPSPKLESVAALSPRLASVTLTSTAEKRGKRKLFQDSGLGEDEAEDIPETQVANETANGGSGASGSTESGALEILRSSNRQATLHAKFKTAFGVSFTELTRPFKSDKTTCISWVVGTLSVSEEVLNAAKILLQQQSDYLQLISYNFDGLFLLQFKHAKSRETVRKMFATMLNINEMQLLLNPPKVRSLPTALYFYTKSLGNASYQHGEVPDWIKKQTAVSHQMAATSEAFDLAIMVQWAYDNDYLDEPSVAYNYALIAQEDTNANAWLKSNCQAKYVRDCVYMVRLFKKQEMRDMTMSAWISKCCLQVDGEGDWKPIGMFLKFQNVNMIAFLSALRVFLKGIPKKQCIVIHGPPDTGKSMFAYSFVKFLKGQIVSYMNSRSHFWLSPLTECKVGLLDDATMPCWLFLDVNLRSALDGNTVCVDTKHRNPIQMKLPPLLVTTNIDVTKEVSLLYLHSRLQTFCFPNKMPMLDNGNPMYTFTDQNWKCFFTKLAKSLDLTPTEEHGDSERTLQLHTRTSTESI